MRVAIVGAGGQLGQDLAALLGSSAVSLRREAADLTQPATFRTTLAELQPDAVVNCAAYNFVDRAESEPAEAFRVNALGVRELAFCCAALDTPLVHVSTDYVFGLDNARTTPYRADDAPGPVNVYGASKLAGESFVRALCPRHLILRTCGLYGRHGVGGKGGNFVETILRRATAGEPLRVVGDQYCTPTPTAFLARAIAALLEKKASGLYHVTAAGACTWHEFASAVLRLADVQAAIAEITSADFQATARRPRFSVLDNSRFDRLDVLPRPTWEEGLAEYLRGRMTDAHLRNS